MATRPRNPKGFGPRVKDEIRYNREMRRAYLIPFIDSVTNSLALAAAVTEAYYRLDTVTSEWLSLPRAGVPQEKVEQYFRQVEGWHRAKLIEQFRRAAAVDIRAYLSTPEVAEFLRTKIDENIDLIKTVPERYRDGLRANMQAAFEAEPFDQDKLMKLVRSEGRSANYNLRRITRDQTNKAVGNLNEIRQRQVGVKKYIWRTAQDERVRPTHRALDGMTFRWDTPPAIGHPGFEIQCRCYPESVMDSIGQS